MASKNAIEDTVSNVVEFVRGAKRAARRLHEDDEDAAALKDTIRKAYANGAKDAAKAAAELVKRRSADGRARSELLELLAGVPDELIKQAEEE